MPRPNVRSFIAAALCLAASAANAAAIRDELYGVCALGPKEAFAVGTFGAIAHTTDAGTTWTTVDSGTKLPLFSVDFADHDHGWAVGKSGVALATVDGGRTWTPQSTPIGRDKHLFKVRAVDPSTAWAVGDWGAITRTTDGGRTWVDRSLAQNPIHADEEAPGRHASIVTDDVILYDVTFPDRMHGYICGEFGTVIATGDGGETWHLRRTPTEKTLFGLYFATVDEGWAVGLDGLVLHTTDGGHQWTVQHGTAETAPVEEISFIEQMNNPGMYAVRVSGRYGVVVGDVGMLLVSDDGGRTWQRRQLPEAQRLVWMRDVSLVDGRGFLVGGNGLRAVVTEGRVRIAETNQADTPVP